MGPATGLILAASLMARPVFLDAGVCPMPSPSIFDPYGASNPHVKRWRSLYPRPRPGLRAYLVAMPSFSASWMVAVERSVAEGHRWKDDSGNDFNVRRVEARGESARAVVAQAPIGPGIAKDLLALWGAVLRRTQYVEERFESGEPHRTVGRDGTTYYFWLDGRSAMTWSPEDGTLLGQFVSIADELGKVAQGNQSIEQLRSKVGDLQKRLQATPPCLELRDR